MTQNDLISRTALLEKLKNLYTDRDKYDEYNYGVESAIIEAENLPAVEVKPITHSRWISLEPEIGLYECENCEHKILRAKCNYCPNCGSRMVEDNYGTE